MRKFPIRFVLGILYACSAAMAAIPSEKNELFIWGLSGLQMIPTRPVVGISAGGGASFAIQDDGQVVEWGQLLRAPSIGIRGATKIIPISPTELVALMNDGTLRSIRSGLESARKVMDIAYLNGKLVVLDSNHLARTVTPGGVWYDSVPGVKSVALTADNVWYLRDDGVVLKGRVPMPELGMFRKLTAGVKHVVGLRMDSTVSAWGTDSSHNQTRVPANLSAVVDLQAGWCHTIALRRDGSVESWGIPCPGAFKCPTSLASSEPICGGLNPRIPEHPPAGLGKVRAIAAGEGHSMVLLQDGQIVAWGDSMDRAVLVPQGRSEVAAVAVENTRLLVLHKDGKWSGGQVNVQNVQWNLGSSTNASGLKSISGSGDHFLGLDSSGVLHSWDWYGSARSLPTEATFLDKSVAPLRPDGITSISAGPDAFQKSDGRVFVIDANGICREAAKETRGARQILSANGRLNVLQKDGTVLWVIPEVAEGTESLPWTRIRRLFGGGSAGLVGQDSTGAIFVDGPSMATAQWHAIPSGPADLASFPRLAAMDVGVYGMVGLDSAGHLVGWGDHHSGPLLLPAAAPRLQSVGIGTSFGVGGIVPGPLYSTTEPKRFPPIPSRGLALGAYPARLFDPRGNLLWEGQATWTESGWVVPSKVRGLAVLRARTPFGMRVERIFLAR